MSLNETLMADLKAAMMAKDEIGKRTLRMLKSDLGKKEVELGRDLTEEEELTLLTGAVKSRKDSLAEYEKAGREDLAEGEREELAVLARYLPEPLDDAAARAAIAALAEELGVTEKKQMGALMKEVMVRFRGQIDGKLASKIAGSLLS
ncbi:MAG: GatB/YqeY domain-containing protein [Sandaracinaceae bacterium]|nr:GatB/YqeY domain-containing protein [Sandaracinaceae bacterium]